MEAKLIIQIILNLIYVGIFLSVSYYDLKERRVPNNIVFPAMGLGFIAMFFFPPGWGSGLLGALIGGGIMLLPVVAFGKKGGMGDVKLAMFMGLIIGSSDIFTALLVAHVAAAFLFIGMLFKWLQRDSLIPFAPFLSFGALWVMFVPNLLERL